MDDRHPAETARAWIAVAACLDARGSRSDAVALRREALALARSQAPADDGVLAELTRAFDASGDAVSLGELHVVLKSAARCYRTRDVLVGVHGRRGDVTAVAELVRCAGGWQGEAMTLLAGLAGLVARGDPGDAEAIELLLLPLARSLTAAPNERWEMKPHAARAAVHAETVVATALALLDRNESARVILERLLETVRPRAEDPIGRARIHAWCAAIAAALGDPNGGALLREADACIDAVDDGDDIDGYTAKLRQEMSDARHHAAHLASTRQAPLGQRTLASSTKAKLLSTSFVHFGEMNYAAERRAGVEARAEIYAQLGHVARVLDVLAEAADSPDADPYVLGPLVSLAAGALSADADDALCARLEAAARSVPLVPRVPQPDSARSAALASVATALARVGRFDQGLTAARAAKGLPRREALAQIALALLGHRRDAEARAVLDDVPVLAREGLSNRDAYVNALVTRARAVLDAG